MPFRRASSSKSSRALRARASWAFAASRLASAARRSRSVTVGGGTCFMASLGRGWRIPAWVLSRAICACATGASAAATASRRALARRRQDASSPAPASAVPDLAPADLPAPGPSPAVLPVWSPASPLVESPPSPRRFKSSSVNEGPLSTTFARRSFSRFAASARLWPETAPATRSRPRASTHVRRFHHSRSLIITVTSTRSTSHQHHGGPRAHPVAPLRGQDTLGPRLGCVLRGLTAGVHETPPRSAGRKPRQLEGMRLPVRVGDQVDVVVSVVRQEVHGEGVGIPPPVRLAKPGAVPGHDGGPRPRILEEGAAAQRRVRLAGADQAGDGAQGVGGLLAPRPVQPAHLAVQAVGVVVAALGAAELVAPLDHGDALGEQEEGHEVAHLAPAQGHDLRVRGRPLLPAVPRQVVVVPVGVGLAVLPVALLVVAHEGLEGEAVVAGEEVDAVPRLAARGLVY